MWEVTNSNNSRVQDPVSIKRVARYFFADIYREPNTFNINEQLEIIKLFPSYFSADEGLYVFGPVTLKEVKSTLKIFAKDKSPGPDGWTIDFYLFFFDLFGQYLVDAIEDSRLSGLIPETLNNTFLTLIPKVDRPATFADYRPIALCNLMYKLITKIIAERIKPFLGVHVSDEQFGFLPDHRILDAVGLVQEVLHSAKARLAPAISLKIDLEKSYDKVNWSFLCLTLFQIGLPFEMVRWIMACVTGANFIVLINEVPSESFNCSRGIRQGFPLSPYLFLLIIEGLSLLIARAKKDKRIKGLKVIGSLIITHILFVDDVLLFGDGSLLEWLRYINLFCAAAEMFVSERKSVFASLNVSQDISLLISQQFSHPWHTMEDGFTYMGFSLKPNNYLVDD